MEEVFIVGAGFMGAGIAQVCAQAGFSVSLMDIDKGNLSKALKRISWSLEKIHAKGLCEEAPAQVMDRIESVGNLDGARKADWVIEAAPEEKSLKMALFKQLDQLAPISTPLTTNTSSIPITQVATATANPERVVGLHFFGPVPLMRLVEVVKGMHTADEVFEKSVSFIRSLGKVPVKVNKDIPGFVMNRIFCAALSEAMDLVAAGVVSIPDVDTGMRLGYGWTAGPFETVDNAGLDTFALIGQFLETMGEDRLCSRSDMLEQLVAEGRIGRKAGKGFYQYDSQGERMVPDSDP